MNHVRITIAVTLIVMLVALPGCNSKKDKSAQTPAPQQAVTPTSPKAGEAQAPQVAASPQDEAETAVLKAKVLAQVKAGDFVTIYKEASAGFREVGPEKQFVGLWQQQLLQTGPFKEAKEVSHTIRPQDKFHVFIYTVQYEKMKKVLRLTFGRSKKGQMELTGINQRDVK